MQKAVKTASLNDVYELASKHNVVAIDEGQFFTEIVEFC